MIDGYQSAEEDARKMSGCGWLVFLWMVVLIVLVEFMK